MGIGIPANKIHHHICSSFILWHHKCNAFCMQILTENNHYMYFIKCCILWSQKINKLCRLHNPINIIFSNDFAMNKSKLLSLSRVRKHRIKKKIINNYVNIQKKIIFDNEIAILKIKEKTNNIIKNSNSLNHENKDSNISFINNNPGKFIIISFLIFN